MGGGAIKGNDGNGSFQEMTLPDFEGWAIFALVAEHQSFSAAARELNTSKATVSKAIARLERSLGVQLFHRTSRRLTLSDSGAALVERARLILQEGRAADECGKEGAAAPAGLVRVAAPMSFGLSHLGEPLAAFLAEHPGVQVELALSDARADLVAYGFDLALRIGTLEDSSLMARRLRTVRLHACAAPTWLARHGLPAHPRDLPPEAVIAYANSREAPRATFTKRQEQIVLPLAGRLRANNADVSLPSVFAGLGVAILPDFIAQPHLESGALAVILSDWALPELGLFLVTPPGRLRPRRVELLLQYLTDTFAR